jgi:predicted amidohydrolase
VAFFPENSLYMRLKEGEPIAGFDLNDRAFSALSSLAQKKGISLHLGSVPLREQGRLVNASVLVTAQGQVECTYRKLHLFDICLEGRKPHRESDVFTPGSAPAALQLGAWSFGQTICYDVRFAELFSAYAKKEVDAVLVPAAFLVETGKAHWEVLLRARAIESQCYVIAAAQAGTHLNSRGDQRQTHGRSLLISPWGEILWQGSAEKPEIAVLSLDRSQLSTVRRQIPMKNHRRL